jgi:hypothetical protein
MDPDGRGQCRKKQIVDEQRKSRNVVPGGRGLITTSRIDARCASETRHCEGAGVERDPII